jgi:hypothetical protein
LIGVLGRALVMCLAFWVGSALGGEIEIRSAALNVGDEALTVEAEFDVGLTSRLEDVVSRGVPLYFLAEFELTRPRWYWFDETVAAKGLSFRLSYHAITRQYRLSTGALHQSFATLEEALRILSRVRDWSVADKSALRPGVTYYAALRLRLDLTQLPKPLQVTAIGSKEWSLASEWLRWNYTAPAEREPK